MKQSAATLERSANESRIQLGVRLKEKREEKRLAITSLARLTGVSPNTIRAIERGQPCHRASLQRIVDTLNEDGAKKPSERPLLREDLDIAALYHDAPTALRNFVSQLLKARDYATFDGPDTDAMILAHDLAKLPKDSIERNSIATLVTFYCKHIQVKAGTSTGRRQPNPDKRK